MKKISIIGAGNMGAAIARGAVRANCGSVCVSNPSMPKLQALAAECPGILTTTSNIEAARSADILILAVKPWKLQGVIDEIAPALEPERQSIVSIAGGVSLDDIDEMLAGAADVRNLQTGAIFHVIPDTAISVGHGMTFVSSKRASQEQTGAVEELFASMGDVAVIEERLMGAATALSSCGIAYAYKYIQASVQAGVQLGFYPRQALEYTIATVDGSIAMLRANGTLPQQEIDRVTTPGGMTIKGINSLEKSAFASAVIEAILSPLTSVKK